MGGLQVRGRMGGGGQRAIQWKNQGYQASLSIGLLSKKKVFPYIPPLPSNFHMSGIQSLSGVISAGLLDDGPKEIWHNY